MKTTLALWAVTLACTPAPLPLLGDACTNVGHGVVDSNLRTHVALLAAEPRRSPSQREAARAYVQAVLAPSGVPVEKRPFQVSGVSGVNLLAGDCSQGSIAVGAHLDSAEGAPGADDNASGVAVVLEAVRLLGRRERFCAVFFDAEEVHAAGVGSDHRNYAYGSQALVDQGFRPAVMVVVESVGFTCRTPRCQQMPRGLKVPGFEEGLFIALVGNLSHRRLWTVAEDALSARLSGPRGVLRFHVPGDGSSVPQARFSDHAPFWDVGVPALMVTDTALLRNPHYHQPTDRPETVDQAFMGAVASGVVTAVAHLLHVLPR